MPRPVKTVGIRPKRRIERVKSVIVATTNIASQPIICHSAEDKKTLVRTIIDLWISPGQNDAEFAAMFAIEPASVAIAGPVIAAGLDQPVPNQVIWGTNAIGPQTLVDGGTPLHIYADMKVMRKLSVNDELVLTHRGAHDGDFHVRGQVHMWFKE